MKMKWVGVNVYIRHNATGEVREYKTRIILMDDQSTPSDFQWSDGNYACDCNRELFFERAAGHDIETIACSDGRFSVNLENPITGECYYREFEES